MEIDINYKVKFHIQLTFPAVTLCNYNRINCDQLLATIGEIDRDSDQETYESLNQLRGKSGCPITQTAQNSAPTNDNSATGGRRKRAASAAPSSDQTTEVRIGEMPDFLSAEYEFLEVYMALNESLRHKIGHQFDGFIKECTFRGMDCLNTR